MIEGLITNEKFQYILMYNAQFIRGNYDTSFIENNIDEMLEWSRAYE